MRTKRHDHIHVRADAFDQPPKFGEVRGHVERAIHRAKDVHARLGALFPLGFLGHTTLGLTELGKEPCHRAVGGFPLVFVDGARQKPLNIGALRRYAAADHFRDGPRHDHRRKGGIKRVPSPLHSAFGAVAAKLFFAQPCDDDGQFMGRQRVGIVQD